MDTLLEPWIDYGFFTFAERLHFDRGQNDLWSLFVAGFIGAILYYVLIFKEQYIPWFEAFTVETDRQRLRGTIIVWSYLLFIALLIVVTFVVINVRRVH
ncbi:MAG TPA: hypothetical protein VG962_14300 [Steroidobacteraceae bacterium]|nr:hypothetical protein [Steroidobacteraceae bacterium]